MRQTNFTNGLCLGTMPWRIVVAFQAICQAASHCTLSAGAVFETAAEKQPKTRAANNASLTKKVNS
ncbi:hypothetical protein LMG28727_06364 [Paraburkholderia kirstenboschensis]|nr:hypothetical protein LMG28727_06364 [Paraburkholderia kirstenboschensis]